MDDKEKYGLIQLVIATLFMMQVLSGYSLLDYLHGDSEYNVIIVDKRAGKEEKNYEMN